MKTTLLLAILFLLLTLPWLALAVLGAVWLWQQHYLLPGASVVLSAYGLAWLLGRKLQHDEPWPASLPRVDPDDRWSPAAQEAWDRIDALAKSLNPADYPLTEPARLIALAQRIIVEVAARFRPDAGRAELDVPLRSILFILEKVSRDMRELLDDKVPFSHLITVKDGLQLWRWKEKLGRINFLRRTLAMAASPLTAIPNELAQFFTGRIARYPKGLLERWLLETLARKIGYYAIGLYSGHLLAPQVEWADRPPEEREMPKRPLKVLIAGQTNAGKSSLINALLGDFRATVDVLPVEDELRLYKLRHSNMDELWLYDSPGYGEASSGFKGRDRRPGEFDLVIVVCSAVQAGREADSRFLHELRDWFAGRLERRMPPVLAVVSHIDRLRPYREWNPPYDLTEPAGDKAQNIKDAVEAVAEALQLPAEDCLPVCLYPPEAVYNLEAVLAGIAQKLPEGLRTQYLRTLAEGRRKEKIELLIRQLGLYFD